jgi:hypothetical protein
MSLNFLFICVIIFFLLSFRATFCFVFCNSDDVCPQLFWVSEGLLWFKGKLGASVGFEVPTTVVLKTPVVWDMTPRSLFKVGGCFGRTLPPSSGSKNKLRAGCACRFLAWFVFQP